MGILLGILLSTAGLLLATGWMPGSAGMALGPRIGVGLTLLTLGGLMLAIPWTRYWIQRRAVPEDYEGRCPVGESCPECGAFNMKPRQACRSCAGPVNEARNPS